MSDISINTSTTGVLSCNLDYTREGFVPLVYVVGDNVKIEATLLIDNTSDVQFADNLTLKEGWTGSATEDEKNTDPTKTDVYSRFSTDPEDDTWDDVDFDSATDGALRGVNSPIMYRGFQASKFQVDTGDEQISASARIEDSEEDWKFSGKIGLGSRIQDASIPYIRIQGGNKSLEYTNRNKNKMVSLIVEGGSHTVSVASFLTNTITSAPRPAVVKNGDTSIPWFLPVNVLTTDRFKRFKVYKSFRGTIVGALDNSDTENDTRDDTTAAAAYAVDYLKTTTIPSISGSIEMVGTQQYSIGEQIGRIITRNGSTPVNLAIVDQSTNYAPPRQSGGGQDTVTIELGRK